jgi:hypothetical protein
MIHLKTRRDNALAGANPATFSPAEAEFQARKATPATTQTRGHAHLNLML